MKIVSILNISSNSFSGDSLDNLSIEEYKKAIEQEIKYGADIIDIGAESTAPNSQTITSSEEQSRLTNVFQAIKDFPDQVFSLDTRNASTAQIGINHGIKIINDVSGGRNDPAMLPLIAQTRVKFIMMYCKNENGTATTVNQLSVNQLSVNQLSVNQKINSFFDQQLKITQELGITKEQLILDPGMGAFLSDNWEDSITVLNQIPELKKRYNLPVFIGVSRKGFLSQLNTFDFGPQERLGASLATGYHAQQQGADFLRVHDTLATKQFFQSLKKLTNLTNTSSLKLRSTG